MDILPHIPPSEDLEPGLYLVATPIGNLGDISVRALRTLRDCDIIYAEDTRHSGRLLNHYGISTPVRSYHKFNEAARQDALLEAIGSGQIVAMISDAGTPGLNDPGNRAVSGIVAAGYPVRLIPGASAVSTAVVISGWAEEGFEFLGYAPPKSGRRDRQIHEIAAKAVTQVLFETPHRIVKWLTAAAPILGDRPLCAVKELTKKFERHYRGSAQEILHQLEGQSTKGEWVLVISPLAQKKKSSNT